MKVHLILVDGMRPESLDACGNPFVKTLLENSLYTLDARTVMPSLTLPCHLSLFLSVDPSRHGTIVNTYAPQARPVNGICEQLKTTHKCGMVYVWGPLRDLAQPTSVVYSRFFMGKKLGRQKCDRLVTEDSIWAMKNMELDFLFTYLGWPDIAGHAEGWMGEEYLRTVNESFSNIQRMLEETTDEWLTIILADHGGHERTHGTEMEEDMRIPVILHGMGLKGKIEKDVSIKDIAPTIVKVLGVESDPEWEGTSIL